MEHDAGLTTTYLGLELRTPIVASPCPLTGSLDGIRRLVAAGVGAVVLPSVHSEQIWTEAHRRLGHRTDSLGALARVSAQRPAQTSRLDDAADTLELLRRARAETDVPLIASINGGDAGGWPAYAHALQQAGADAIELNIFEVPAGTGDTARAIEDRHLEILAVARSAVTIPIAVKLSPWLSATGELAGRLLEGGAAGLVLFNRFVQPDIDVERVAVVRSLELSTPWEARLPMTWIALLRDRTTASLAATTGVAGPDEVVKYLLAGADVVMTASALLRHGPEYAAELAAGVADWMRTRGFASVAEFRGLLRAELGETAAAKRGAYVDVLAAGTRTYERMQR